MVNVKLSALTHQVVILVRMLDPDTRAPIFETFIRATDDEIKRALDEDGAGPGISVGAYKRAVSTIRSRQLAPTAAAAAAAAAYG